MANERKRSWSETINAISRTFKKHGVVDYEISPIKSPVERRNTYCPPNARTVRVAFFWPPKRIVLTCADSSMPHENLEKLALVIDTLYALRGAEAEQIMVSAYQQRYFDESRRNEPNKAPPITDADPYAVLGVERHYPLSVIEAIWKARLRVEHPDAGGSAATAKRLNAAMADIRKRRA